MKKQDTRNVLFDVFQHPESGAFFAFGELPDKSAFVVEKNSRDTVPVARPLTTLAAMRLMGEKLRRGYQRGKSTMYFDPVEQVFTHVHPDLSWGGKSWLLAARSPTVQAGIDAVVAEMRRLPESVVLPIEVDAWAQRQINNAAYIVAFNDLPVWSLVLAETSLKEGWTVRANPHLAGAPALLPSMNPLQWDEWLQQLFDLKLVQSTRAELGFTLDNIEKPDQQELIESENWSALI